MLLEFFLFLLFLKSLFLVSGLDSELSSTQNLLHIVVVCGLEVLGELVEFGVIFLSDIGQGDNGSVFLMDKSS